MWNPNRTRLLFDLLRAKLAHAGKRLHAGKTMTWNKRGSRFWAPLWVQTDSCRKQRRSGWKKRTAFGKPCHRFRRVPGRLSFKPQVSLPQDSASQADNGTWKASARVLGRLPGNQRQTEVAHLSTNWPMRLGGLGLRNAAKMAPAPLG